MFCATCGKEVSATAAHCDACGTRREALPDVKAAPAAAPEMTFTRSISTCLAKYVNYHGRAGRPEYWWFYLFTLLLSWAALAVDKSGLSYLVIYLGLAAPSWAACVRRLHDTNRSGWWSLLPLTIIGVIPLIYWLARPGDEGANEYGPRP